MVLSFGDVGKRKQTAKVTREQIMIEYRKRYADINNITLPQLYDWAEIIANQHQLFTNTMTRMVQQRNFVRSSPIDLDTVAGKAEWLELFLLALTMWTVDENNTET